MGLKNTVESVMYGRERFLLLELFLVLVSLPYRVAVNVRSSLYRMRVLQSRSLSCRVISVGNLTVGGTGKTPAVIQIARTLAAEGQRPAVLSRGYGRENEREIVVVSDGAANLVDATRGGDEPLLMASRLPGVPVVVGADRLAAGTLVLERFRPHVVVLDDGFQHLRLDRDLNIVLLDASDPFGNGRLFPAGILREPPRQLRRADAVLLTRADSEDRIGQVRAQVRKYSDAPIFTSRQVPVSLTDLRSGAATPLDSVRGQGVLAFTGIARPSSFFSLLTDMGAAVLEKVPFPDHYRYTRSDLDALAIRARTSGAGMIITTEKDAVKLRGMDPRGIWSLGIEQEVREAEAWKKLLTEEA